MYSIVKTPIIFGTALTELPQVSVLSVRYGHWFTKFYKLKKQQRPLSKAVQLKYKELSKETLPDPKSVPKLLKSYLDEQGAPDSVRKIYSFEHLGIDAAIDELIRERAESLQLHPVEDATAMEIVRLTVLIRVQHEQSNSKWNKSLERRHLEMIDKRDNLLSLLRSENYNQFLAILQRLNLDYRTPLPPNCIPVPELAAENSFQRRLQRTRDLCHRLKLRRLDQLEERMDNAKAEFVERKGRKLKEAEEKLNRLELSLGRVLQEVYDDREREANSSLLADRLSWFYGEQWARRNVQKKLREKEEAAASRGRGRK